MPDESVYVPGSKEELELLQLQARCLEGLTGAVYADNRPRRPDPLATRKATSPCPEPRSSTRIPARTHDSLINLLPALPNAVKDQNSARPVAKSPNNAANDAPGNTTMQAQADGAPDDLAKKPLLHASEDIRKPTEPLPTINP
jgi:hypothetical protein